MNNWIDIIQHLIYPPTCLLCEAQGYGNWDLCQGCFQSLRANSHACSVCGIPLHGVTNPLTCGNCLTKPPAFNACQSLFVYDAPTRYLIRQLKYHNNLACARLMGEIMANKLAALDPKPELLIPIPLHSRRYRQRRFNQATEIARPISRQLGIPINLSACVRIRDTTPQFNLPAKQRKKNLRNAFAMKNVIDADHIVIIDDVVTTGNTVNEFAKLVRRSGVKRVDVWSFARA